MITLPRYTYNLVFLRTDGDQELVEHATEKDAREHLALFGIEDADIYQRIDLFDTSRSLESRTRISTSASTCSSRTG